MHLITHHRIPRLLAILMRTDFLAVFPDKVLPEGPVEAGDNGEANKVLGNVALYRE